MVTLLGLSNDVESNTVLNGSINLEVNGDLTSLGLGKDSLTVLLADTNNGSKLAKGLTKGTSELARNIVVDNDSSSSGSLTVGRLLREGALSSKNENNLTLRLSGEITSLAAKVLSNDKRTSSLTSRSVSHDGGSDIIAVNLEGGSTGRVQLSEGLLLDVVVASRLEGLVEVVDSGVVTSSTEDTGVAVGLSDVLELLGSGHEVLDVDVLLELELVDEGLLGGAGRQGEEGEG